MQLDVLIFGGGAAGLWLLDVLSRNGHEALLLESDRLGAGQTIAAQGIIHGGLKYTLQGALTPSAVEIREMPRLWQECLAGRLYPNLGAVRIRAAHCYLWRTNSLSSKLGMIGARVGLRITPHFLAADERPAVLQRCPGPVARLSEQVIAPDSLLQTLFVKYRDRILKVDSSKVEFERGEQRLVRTVRLSDSSGRCLSLEPRRIVLTAGRGNAELRRQIGLAHDLMQQRPLHMVLLRGQLPVLNGHCVDGAATRITVTSDKDLEGRVVWQVGGQIAEGGTTLEERTLILRAKSEIEATIPGISLQSTEWSTYRVDRAEGATSDGTRPESVQIIEEHNVLTAWPTKLALVPILAQRVLKAVGPSQRRASMDLRLLNNWPRPEVAQLPWETMRRWWSVDELSSRVEKAA